MNIKEDLGKRAHRFDDLRPKGNIRDEMPVHDVEMEPVRTGISSPFRSFAKASMVGGKKRWGYYHLSSFRFHFGVVRHFSLFLQ
jgi:hypothetical protein